MLKLIIILWSGILLMSCSSIPNLETMSSRAPVSDSTQVVWSAWKPCPPWDSAKTVKDLRVLLAKGVNPNIKKASTYYPLDSIKNIEGMQVLLEGGADPATRSIYDLYPHRVAALFIAHGLNPSEGSKVDGIPPVYSVDEALVKWALKQGVDPNTHCREHKPACGHRECLATQKNRTRVVTPLEIICTQRQLSADEMSVFVKLFLKYGGTIYRTPEQPLYIQCSYDDPTEIKNLLLRYMPGDREYNKKCINP